MAHDSPHTWTHLHLSRIVGIPHHVRRGVRGGAAVRRRQHGIGHGAGGVDVQPVPEPLRMFLGMLQLDAFVRCCRHGMECMCVCHWEDNGWRNVNVNNVDDEVLMNNTVVDNESGRSDVTVFLSWKKMWHGIRNAQFRPSSSTRRNYAECAGAARSRAE